MDFVWSHIGFLVSTQLRAKNIGNFEILNNVESDIN